MSEWIDIPSSRIQPNKPASSDLFAAYAMRDEANASVPMAFPKMTWTLGFAAGESGTKTQSFYIASFSWAKYIRLCFPIDLRRDEVTSVVTIENSQGQVDFTYDGILYTAARRLLVAMLETIGNYHQRITITIERKQTASVQGITVYPPGPEERNFCAYIRSPLG